MLLIHGIDGDLLQLINIFFITHIFMYNVAMFSQKSDDAKRENKVYDTDNVFARILRQELPCKKASHNDIIFESQYAVAIYDINPRKHIHILLLPKGQYVDIRDYLEKAAPEEKISLYSLMYEILKHCKNGRVESNFDSYQEVPHLHWHIMADEWI